MEMVKTGSLVMVLALFTAAACAVEYLDRTVRVPSAQRHDVPARVGRWQKVREIDFGENVLATLGTRDVIGRVYGNAENRAVDLTIVRAVNNRAAFHPPEYCLTGSGYELVSKGVRRCRLSAGPTECIDVNEMVFVSKGRRKMLVWNWYIAGSLVTADFYRQQLQLLKDELCSGKGEGALVTLSTMLDNDDAQQANAANTDFTRVLLPLLRSHEQSQAVVD